MAVDGSICSVYLVAVLWKDTNYCSGYPDFPQGVKSGNGLTSIEWCKLLRVLITLGLGHTQLNLQGALEAVWLLGQYCRSYMVWWYISCGCTASERVREVWYHQGGLEVL